MHLMDENLFFELQKSLCWFTLPIFENLPDIDLNIDVLDKSVWRDDILVQRHIFAMIFGGFGYNINLTRAKSIAIVKLGQIEKCEPQDKSMNNPEFVQWIEKFARYNILLGTIFAYQQQYLMAASLLMNGLKTRAINLFRPYCDFIKRVLLKVEEMPAELVEYEGGGFSADEPMGSLELNCGNLFASAAEMVIPALEGNNKEIILAYQGAHSYGKIRRLGSTNSQNFRNCIDIYEVLAIDRNFNLKKIRFYFNGYFGREAPYTIRLPKGFRLDPLSQAAEFFRVVD